MESGHENLPWSRLKKELLEERQTAEEVEKQAKDAIEAKVKELAQIEEDRQREVRTPFTQTCL